MAPDVQGGAREANSMGITKLGLTKPRDSQSERARRREPDRRRDSGRRIIRERRREVVPVEADKRKGGDRRSGVARRSGSERRSH